jgi:hypothetical protein
MNIRHNMVRWVAVGAVAAAALAAVAAPSATSAPAPKAVKTAFALQSFAYGTRLAGHDVPVNSGKTAFSLVSCTTLAGISDVNQVLGVAPPAGIDAINGVRSHSWTTTHNGTVSSWSSNKIASVVLADLGAGSLKLNAIVARSHVWHDAQGFHTAGRTSLGSIKLTVGGVTTDVPVPAPGQSVTVPLVAKITLGVPGGTTGGGYATGNSNALVVTILPTASKVNVGHAFARIDSNPNGGIFKGNAYSSKVAALDGTIKSGPTSLRVMPCTGTHGQLLRTNTATVSIPAIGALAGLHSAVRGSQHQNGWASGLARNSVAKVQLAGGRLVIIGVRGAVHVTKTGGGKWLKSASGTTVARIKFNGNPLTVPDPGVPLTIPGIAKIYYKDVHKSKHGLAVNALKIRLLYQTAAHSTIWLGHAQLKISPK